ncbi:MAG: hypothetical protein ACPHUE_07500, partial [Flavobacteriaceae bacterium]
NGVQHGLRSRLSGVLSDRFTKFIEFHGVVSITKLIGKKIAARLNVQNLLCSKGKIFYKNFIYSILHVYVIDVQ